MGGQDELNTRHVSNRWPGDCDLQPRRPCRSCLGALAPPPAPPGVGAPSPSPGSFPYAIQQLPQFITPLGPVIDVQAIGQAWMQLAELGPAGVGTSNVSIAIAMSGRRSGPETLAGTKAKSLV
jgi:hypothetical protein